MLTRSSLWSGLESDKALQFQNIIYIDLCSTTLIEGMVNLKKSPPHWNENIYKSYMWFNRFINNNNNKWNTFTKRNQSIEEEIITFLIFNKAVQRRSKGHCDLLLLRTYIQS